MCIRDRSFTVKRQVGMFSYELFMLSEIYVKFLFFSFLHDLSISIVYLMAQNILWLGRAEEAPLGFCSLQLFCFLKILSLLSQTVITLLILFRPYVFL